ncbi:unnamed protein product [Chironomus riparius]|uniref:Uncharacterized protein n=1 Tax=Chironomus riparius TaxID=315576 RepID=A0A9N9WUZ2_9DIPT|nr:unnamed protein product [Chironomus riparius]
MKFVTALIVVACLAAVCMANDEEASKAESTASPSAPTAAPVPAPKAKREACDKGQAGQSSSTTGTGTTENAN